VASFSAVPGENQYDTLPLPRYAFSTPPMTTRRKQLFLAALVILPAIGIIWLDFLGGGYHAELWLKRFDQSVWLENKTEGLYSPRRPMVKSVMRHLKLGMARQEVEKLLGPADRERWGWQAYHIGFPRWETFALDADVFELRYEHGRLVEMRIQST